MSVPLRLEPADPTPPYEQLRRQIASAIISGSLAGGERLPTVRQLARDLGVAPGTVMRAYAELERAGLIATRRGGGSDGAAGQARSGLAGDELARLADGFVTRARELGAADEEIRLAVASRLQAPGADGSAQ